MIHNTAIIDPAATIADNVCIGPYSVIGADVEIGADCVIGPHVVINGPTKIGNSNKIYQFSSIGEDPQDKKYAGEATLLEIGDNNLIRESVTINRGTVQGGGITRIGNDNWIMAYVHIAHDCELGNNTILANNASLAGHVDIHDYAILGGFTIVHQFCKVGAHVITGLGSVIFKDVPTYVTAAGHEAKPHGINSEGLRRRGFTSDEITQIKRAYKVVYRQGLSIEDAKKALLAMHAQCDKIQPLSDFLHLANRGIIR